MSTGTEHQMTLDESPRMGPPGICRILCDGVTIADTRSYGGPPEKERQYARALVHRYNSHARLLAACNGLLGALESVNRDHPDELWLGTEYQDARAALEESQP